jgi:predicted nuclease with RNAse H fold
MRVLGVDWSGKLKRAGECIWLAEVRDGELVMLENGRGREQLVEHLSAAAERDPRTVIGFDFAFSFPQWWCEQQGWRLAPDVWAAMALQGDRLLGECQPPFWGRPGRRRPNPPDRRYRLTELVDVSGAKSVFQIGGAGAVGTGSVRGMPQLQTLARRGFDVWPFGPTGWPRVVEIYPRALTGAVNKSDPRARRALLFERFASQSNALLERAAGSEDAFDAAVSALVMAEHEAELAALSATSDPVLAIEGRVWRP